MFWGQPVDGVAPGGGGPRVVARHRSLRGSEPVFGSWIPDAHNA